MNDAILIQLKILVERAVRPVRPVRASTTHKRKMREELLAHVTSVFEEEHAKLSDEHAALDRTALRFGNSAELTTQLQQSVPWVDWVLRFAEDRFPRPNESTLRYALRFAFCYTLLVIAFFAFLILLVSPTPVAFFIGGIGVVILSFVFSFILIHLWRAMWIALYGPKGRSWPHAVLVAAAASLIGLSALFASSLSSWHADRSNAPIEKYWLEALPLLPGVALGGPFMLIFASYVIWQGLYGRADRSWWQALLENVAWCLAAACVTFGLGVALSGDLSASVGSLVPIVLMAEWVIPADLIFRLAGRYQRLRSDREWADLQID